MKSALVAVVLGGVLLGLAGCSTQEQPAHQAETPGAPQETAGPDGPVVTWNAEAGPWALFISSPRPAGAFQTCLESSAVKSSLQSADEPTSHVSVTFVESATKDDVAGVVDCLGEQLSSGDVSIDKAGATG